MARDIYQEVTNQIITALETGAAPWIKPWSNVGPQAALGVPHNRVSKKAYRGINTLLLWSAKADNLFSADTWLTYKQARDLGGHVRKGEKGTRIVFFKPIEKTTRNSTGEQETTKFCMLRGYTVFNLDQCENVQPLAPVEPQKPVTGSMMLDVAAAIGANVQVQGDAACFIPSHDIVRMPHVDQFKSADHFEATLAHELVHWTGHKSRLDRQLTGRFGSESYAAEELIAEMGAAFVSAEMGFNLSELQHADYIANWLKVLKSDKRAIFTAASQAQKATDYIKETAHTAELAA